MRTSTKYLILAAVLLLGSLCSYDIALNQQYAAGSYKKPFGNFTEMNFSNFNEIDLDASTAANVMVKEGPFAVETDPVAAGYVKINQTGHKLIISAAFPYNFYTPMEAYVVVISCPALEKFKADSKYTTAGRLVTDTLASEDFRWRPSLITGFKSDSLSIEEQHAGSIVLQNNQIGSINATLGIGGGSRSNMVILADNNFSNLNIDIRNKSQVKLECSSIQKLNYKLADSASIIFNGAAQKIIKNHP